MMDVGAIGQLPILISNHFFLEVSLVELFTINTFCILTLQFLSKKEKVAMAHALYTQLYTFFEYKIRFLCLLKNLWRLLLSDC